MSVPSSAAEISPLAQELETVGIVDPGPATGARQGLWEHVFDHRLPEDSRSKRISEIIALQRKYIGRRIYRVAEPTVTGKVAYVRIARDVTGICAHIGRGWSASSPYEAYVLWEGRKAGFVRLNLIEPCPE